MVDMADDLSEVRQNPMERAVKLALTTAQGAAGEIAPEEDFRAAQYSSELGNKTLTRYYSAYLIPEGVVLMALGDAQDFEASDGSVALYE